MSRLTLIVAMTPSGIIAVDGKMPWKVSEDLRRFKILTSGHAIIMGRKTFDSIGKPLPNRRNIVLTRSMDQFSAEKHEEVTGVAVAVTIDDALHAAYENDDAPFVIGGAEIYAQTLAKATHLEVTYIIRDYDHPKPGETEYLSLNRNVRRFAFYEGGGASHFGVEHYPSLWKWRCTKVERALEHDDVEFHSFERRA
jgi:dihydrofolate reductase